MLYLSYFKDQAKETSSVIIGKRLLDPFSSTLCTENREDDDLGAFLSMSQFLFTAIGGFSAIFKI